MNKAALEQYVKEVAGDDPDLASKMLEILGGKEEAANRFLSGFEGKAESTRRFQEAATTKKQSETLIADYQRQLGEAEDRIKKIMKDAATDKISSATARAQLQVVKEKYQLSDEDIPSDADVRFAADKGIVPKGSTDIDIDARLAEFKTSFMKDLTDKLIPELSGMAALPIVWNTINAEHVELTGKRLSKADQTELLKVAREQNKSIEDVWQEKFNIPQIRQTKYESDLRSKYREEFEKEYQAKRTEEALSGGVKDNGVEMVPDSQRSPLLRKKFENQADDGAEDQGRQQQRQEQRQTQQEQPRVRGAEKAAENFRRRRAAGVPWGQEEKKAS